MKSDTYAEAVADDDDLRSSKASLKESLPTCRAGRLTRRPPPGTEPDRRAPCRVHTPLLTRSTALRMESNVPMHEAVADDGLILEEVRTRARGRFGQRQRATEPQFWCAPKVRCSLEVCQHTGWRFKYNYQRCLMHTHHTILLESITIEWGFDSELTCFRVVCTYWTYTCTTKLEATTIFPAIGGIRCRCPVATREV